MNIKRIWMLAILFGFVMSVLFYIITTTNGDTNETAVETESPANIVEETGGGVEEPLGLGITKGKRAISIAVDEIQSVSGFVKPGTYVDIIAILPTTGSEQRNSQVLLENIKVLAVGQTLVDEVTENPEPYQMVTLEVSPEGGVSLALAKEIGTVTLMLRGREG